MTPENLSAELELNATVAEMLKLLEKFSPEQRMCLLISLTALMGVEATLRYSTPKWAP